MEFYVRFYVRFSAALDSILYCLAVVQNHLVTRSSKDETESRVAEALDLLIEGYAPSSIAKNLAKKYKVTLRQARRYVAAAQTDYFDAPMTRNDLEWGVARQLERMEELALEMKLAGDTKFEIQARKAFASMSESRLRAHQKETEFCERVRVTTGKTHTADF